VAAELAFSDQSHMTHSLKRYLGQTPAQLAKQASAAGGSAEVKDGS
jgi:AraC-like DNA-binding protein